MEQCFRIALWMFLLIALSLGSINMPPLQYKLLANVTCEHVNFSSPTNVQEHCRTAALETIKEGLKLARTNCTGEVEHFYISQTLEILEKSSWPSQPTNSSDCKWNNKQFKYFLQDFESFIQSLKSISAHSANKMNTQ